MIDKLKRFLLVLGPGILWATIAIGETHLALLPYAGALFGMSTLWLLLIVHIFYYPNFEYGPRYAVATGESLLDGYGKTRAGKFFYWFFLLLMFVTPPLLMASLVGLTGSVMFAAFPVLDFHWWCILIFIITLGIIIGGKYKVIERIAKVLTLIIVLIAIFAFATSPPSPSEFFSGLIPSLSVTAAFMIVMVAILRMPTDPSVSIFLSKWAQEKRTEWGDNKEVLVSSLKKSLTDIRTGFVISFLVGAVFLSLGAVVLKPRGIIPEGIDVSLRLSEIYTQTFGQWIFFIFIGAALAAFWGTYMSAMDGMKRLFTNVIEKLFAPSERRTRIISIAYIILVATAGLLMTIVIKRPVFMVLLAVSMGLIYYPLIFGMNIYCVTTQIDREFRPGKINLTIAIVGFFMGVSALVLLILVRVLKVFQ
jgi:Mn2+/Fe2+ NRAMP family transporter